MEREFKLSDKEKNNQISFIYFIFATYIILFLFVSLRDYSLDNISDMYLEIVATFVSIIGMIYFYLSKNMIISKILVVWIAYLLILGLLISNKLEHYVVMYAVIVPVVPFLIFSLYMAFFQIIIFYIIFFLIIFSSSMENSGFLSDPDAVFNLIINIIFIFIFGLVYNIIIRTSFKNLEQAYEQNQILLKELNHRVKNNLNMIVSLIGLQIDTNKENHFELIDIKNRIESIAITYNMLYKSKNYTQIEFHSYIKQLIEVIQKTFHDTKDIKIEVFLPEKIKLSIDDMVSMGILLNELITNSFKHAFENKKGEINIKVYKKEEIIKLIYSDNGKGIEKKIKKDESNSLGMLIISSIVQQISGKYSIENRNGFYFMLEFKI